MSDDPVYHSPVEVKHGDGFRNWVLYASKSEPDRLVVFVHGYNGTAVGAWNRFAHSGDASDWWRASDMLFVGYKSRSERPVQTASWLCDGMKTFYPHLDKKHLTKRDGMVRLPSGKPYKELFLVGHSLGGFLVRRALCDEALRWSVARKADAAAPRPPLLDARVRLFSPASAGFSPIGLLGLLKGSDLGEAVDVALYRSSPAYAALKPGSVLLTTTQSDTEQLVAQYGTELAALRAYILWARPEKIVEPMGYKDDIVDKVLRPSRGHTGVCKPCGDYRAPQFFVETGTHR